MHISGMIVNRCVHCATYCMISVDDMHRALAQGNRPRIECHHCQKLFTPGPDIDITPAAANTPITSKDAGTPPPNAAKASAAPASVNRVPLYLLIIAVAIGALYFMTDAKTLIGPDIFKILE